MYTAVCHLHGHFKKHGHKFSYIDVQDYEASAIATVLGGTRFTYDDPKDGDPRIGYYEQSTNRFTAVTGDDPLIVTHFPPDRGEQYCCDLSATTYR